MTLLVVPLVLALVLLCGMRSIYMIQYFFASTSKWLHYMYCPTTTLQPLTLNHWDLWSNPHRGVCNCNNYSTKHSADIPLGCWAWQSGENYQQSSWRNIAHISQRHLTPYRNHWLLSSWTRKRTRKQSVLPDAPTVCRLAVGLTWYVCVEILQPH